MRRENLTRVAVVMSWMQRRIQSLQKRSNFGFILERRIRRAFLPKRSPRVKLCVGLNEYLMEYPVHRIPDDFTDQNLAQEVRESS